MYQIEKGSTVSIHLHFRTKKKRTNTKLFSPLHSIGTVRLNTKKGKETKQMTKHRGKRDFRLQVIDTQ